MLWSIGRPLKPTLRFRRWGAWDFVDGSFPLPRGSPANESPRVKPNSSREICSIATLALPESRRRGEAESQGRWHGERRGGLFYGSTTSPQGGSAPGERGDCSTSRPPKPAARCYVISLIGSVAGDFLFQPITDLSPWSRSPVLGPSPPTVVPKREPNRHRVVDGEVRPPNPPPHTWAAASTRPRVRGRRSGRGGRGSRRQGARHPHGGQPDPPRRRG